MSSINHDMERLGRIVAADQGLDVSCRGMMAYAVPGKIVIPSLENLDHLGEDAERMMHGYLDHECAHASDSDFGLYEKAAKRHEAFKDLLNALEDGYIEGRQGRRFRGSRYNLRQKNEWFWERKNEKGETLPDQMRDPEVDPWRKFTVALTMCVRTHGGREVTDFRDLDDDTFDRLMLCEDDLDEVKSLISKPKATAECYAIAERIWDRFNKNTPGPNKAPKRLQMDLDGWESTMTKVIKMLKDPESAISQALMAVLDGQDLGAGCDFDGNMVDPPDEDNEGGDHARSRGDKPYIVFSREFDYEVDFTGDIAVSQKFETLVDETREAADALVQTFEASLRARMELAPSYGHDEGFIDTMALAEFSVGARPANTIYSQYEGEVDANDVAVLTLVDCSGSMGRYNAPGSKARLAAQAATALYTACSMCQIENEVAGFTTTYNAERWYDQSRAQGWVIDGETAERARQALLEAQLKGQDVSKFARIYQGGDLASLDTASLCFPANAIFKRFGSNDARGISHINGIAANLDGESVLWAARRLAARPEKRRVMFVLSDGLPSAANHHADEDGYLKETVARCIHAGIEVYGIGIMSEAVAEFYPIYWVANDLNDLTDIAMGALMDVLASNRQEHGCVTL